jgi:hypothetical protein
MRGKRDAAWVEPPAHARPDSTRNSPLVPELNLEPLDNFLKDADYIRRNPKREPLAAANPSASAWAPAAAEVGVAAEVVAAAVAAAGVVAAAAAAAAVKLYWWLSG